jgi:Rps23 Pro-64 3,4-dihydroxylase Tpa1-like proline 4-hydroxylase
MHLNGHRESQLAFYPAYDRTSVGPNESRYERHRDAFPTDDVEDQEQRRLTTILYLNPADWSDEDGGSLSVFEPDLETGGRIVQSVSPIGGRLVVFLSGSIDHEVLPCHRNRAAWTIWWR